MLSTLNCLWHHSVSCNFVYFLNNVKCLNQLTVDLLFSQLSWLRVDFNKWKNWEDDSDDENEKFDQFSNVSHLY